MATNDVRARGRLGADTSAPEPVPKAAQGELGRRRRSSARLHAVITAGIAEANSTLSRVAQIKKFAILPTVWEPGGDEITPTMKLKRKPIAERYAAEISALYG
jgi:long-subunit acyl-CoA synthetase (AMP-forming)